MSIRARDVALYLCVAVLMGCSTPFRSEPRGSIGEIGEGGSAMVTAATVLVHYPAGSGHRITLRCGGNGHDWNTGISATWTDGDVWRANVDAGASPIACKPLFDEQSWAMGPNWTVAAGQTVDVWPWFFHHAGTIQQITSWHSQILGNDGHHPFDLLGIQSGVLGSTSQPS